MRHTGKETGKRKRRYRQIGRLLYYYCCVLYMKRIDGKWEQQEVECPVCNGDGEFITEDDVYTCCGCGGIGYISAYRYKKLCEEMK